MAEVKPGDLFEVNWPFTDQAGACAIPARFPARIRHADRLKSRNGTGTRRARRGEGRQKTEDRHSEKLKLPKQKLKPTRAKAEKLVRSEKTCVGEGESPSSLEARLPEFGTKVMNGKV